MASDFRFKLVYVLGFRVQIQNTMFEHATR